MAIYEFLCWEKPDAHDVNMIMKDLTLLLCAHFCSMCGPHFCSMKISQDVRDFAKAEGVSEQEALKKGMVLKAVEFVKKGAEIYHKA